MPHALIETGMKSRRRLASHQLPSHAFEPGKVNLMGRRHHVVETLRESLSTGPQGLSPGAGQPGVHDIQQCIDVCEKASELGRDIDLEGCPMLAVVAPNELTAPAESETCRTLRQWLIRRYRTEKRPPERVEFTRVPPLKNRLQVITARQTPEGLGENRCPICLDNIERLYVTL